MSVHTTARNTTSNKAASKTASKTGTETGTKTGTKTATSDRAHLRSSVGRSPAQHPAKRSGATPGALRPVVSIKVSGDTPHRTARDRLGLIDLDVLTGLRAPSSTIIVPPVTQPAGADQRAVEELSPLVPFVVSALVPAASRWAIRLETGNLETGPLETGTREGYEPHAQGHRQRRSSRSRTQLSGPGQVLLVFLAAFVIAGVAALTNLSRDAVDAPSMLTGATEVTVTVQSGDTLYSIAQRVAPELDPQLVVASITSTNDLSGADVAHLQPGQLLAVPTS